MPSNHARETQHTRDFREQYDLDLQIFLKGRAVPGEPLPIALRRLLGMPLNPQVQFNRLQECMKTMEFLSSRTFTKRYLAVLSALYEQNKDLFAAQVEGLSAGRRVYFARSPRHIERSGTLPRAQRIGESPFWTLTNISTEHKEHIVKAALDGFGYRPITKKWVLTEMRRNLKERKRRVSRKRHRK